MTYNMICQKGVFGHENTVPLVIYANPWY